MLGLSLSMASMPVFGMSAVQRAISILRRPDITAHVYLPGANGAAVSGLLSNNYTLSDGSSGYSSVDGAAGLVLDAMGTVGAEQITNGDNESAVFTFGSMVSANITASRVAAVGGRSGFVMLAQSSSAASVNHQYRCGIGLMQANTAYQITADMYVPTGGVANCRFFDNDDGSYFSPNMTTKDAWVTVSVIRPAKSTAWTLAFGNNNTEIVASGTPAFYLDNVSAKPVTGIHATQSTTANKPAERRGLYNLLTYSQDFINNWSAAATKIATTGPDGTLSATLITTTGGSFNNAKSLLAPSSVVTVCAIVGYGNTATGTTPGLINSYGIYNQTLASDVAYAHVNYETGEVSASGPQAGSCTVSTTPYADGWHLIAITIPAGIAAGDSIYCYMGGVGGTPAAGESFRLWRGGFFAGALTAAQILAEGGIPLTTSAAASNPDAGRYWWGFDGTDSLYATTAPFNQNDDWFMCAAFRCDSAANYNVALHSAVGSNSQGPALMVVQTTGYATLQLYDGTTWTAISDSVSCIGQPIVIWATQVSGVRKFWKNGTLVGTNSTALTPVTSVGLRIGGNGTTGGSLFNGALGPQMAIKGTVSDADALTIARFAASMTPNFTATF